MKSIVLAVHILLFGFSIGLCQTQHLRQVLRSELSSTNPGILFSMASGDKRYAWSGADGINDLLQGDSLRVHQTFRIASVTKTYVAAAILRLMEKKILNLDDPISKHLSPIHAAILSKEYDLEKITIRHILRHSAGFFDHTHAPEFFDKVFSPTGYEWTRTAQLQLGVEKGEPMGTPGNQFNYSDMGYVILGELIETYTGKSLDGGIKELLGLEKLGFSRTDFERIDPQTDQLRIHQYFQGKDTYRLNPTMDYFGGGGIVSNTSELIGFFQALFQGKLFDSPATLESMLEPVTYATESKLDYRLGIFKVQVNGMDAYSHSGFWGTQVVYIPKIDLYMAANYSGGWRGGAVAPIFGKVLSAMGNNWQTISQPQRKE
ncbi:MAG: serine hydrolase domain-containing protein [Spirosomataceae bacterium]